MSSCTHMVSDSPKSDGNGNLWYPVRNGDFWYWCTRKGLHRCSVCGKEMTGTADHRGQNCLRCPDGAPCPGCYRKGRMGT